MWRKFEVEDVEMFIDSLPEAEFAKVKIDYKGRLYNTDDYKAVVKKGSGYLYSIVGNRYVIVQHKEVIKAVEQVIESYNLKPKMRIATVNTKTGVRVFYDVIFEDTKIDGEKLMFGIRVSNSYNGKSSISINGMGIRDVCSNLMVFGTDLMAEWIIHAGKPLDKLIKQILPNTMETLVTIQDVIKAAMKETISPNEILEFVKSLKVSKKMAKRILSYIRTETGVSFEKAMAENIDLNRWGVYNAFTRALTHDTRNLSQETVHELNKRVSKLIAVQTG